MPESLLGTKKTIMETIVTLNWIDHWWQRVHARHIRISKRVQLFVVIAEGERKS